QTGQAVDIDVIGAETLQAVREEILYRLGPPVHADEGVVRCAHAAEFYGQKNVRAAAFESTPQQHFVVAHAVEIPSIEQIDAGVDGRVDSPNALLFVGGAVHTGHSHAAQADCADHWTYGPESPCLHNVQIATKGRQLL